MKIIYITVALCITHLTVIGQTRRCSTDEYRNYLKTQYPQLFKKETSTNQRISSYLNKATNQKSQSSVITIPVVVHVVEVSIPKERINAQIRTLNEDYRRRVGTPGYGFSGFDTEIEFVLAKRKPDGTSSDGINLVEGNFSPFRFPEDDPTLKSLAHWDADDYLNIYVCELDETLGYATFPADYELNKATDGVVIDANYFGPTGDPKFGMGRTLTHEVGHWLNLYHTWGDRKDCSGTDYCEDTPACSAPFYSESPACALPIPANQCGEGARLVEDYMDYSDDACMSTFTFDQRERMRAAIYSVRPSLLSSKGGIPPEGASTGGGNIGSGNCPPLHSAGGGQGNLCNITEYRSGQCATLVNESFSFPHLSTYQSRGWKRAIGSPITRQKHPFGNILLMQASNVLECGAPDGVFWSNTKNFDAGIEYSLEFDAAVSQTSCSDSRLFFYLAKGLKSSLNYSVSLTDDHEKSLIGYIAADQCNGCLLNGKLERVKFNFIPPSSNFDQILMFIATNTSQIIYIDNFTIKEGASVQIENELEITGSFDKGYNNSNSPFFARKAALSKSQDQNLHIESGATFIVYGTQEILMKPGFIARFGSELVARTVPEPDPCANSRSASLSASKKPYQDIDTTSSLKSRNNVVLLYPNPFTNDVTINYTVEIDAAVDLSIFNVAGHQVKHPIREEFQRAGNHEIIFDTSQLPAGVYMYRLKTGEQEVRGKLIKQ